MAITVQQIIWNMVNMIKPYILRFSGLCLYNYSSLRVILVVKYRQSCHFVHTVMLVMAKATFWSKTVFRNAITVCLCKLL
jgi:hypothetical protein